MLFIKKELCKRLQTLGEKCREGHRFEPENKQRRNESRARHHDF